MRYFRPDIRLAMPDAQTAHEDRLGGLPYGLPSARWPRCSACKKPQTLLAQLHHDPSRLELGADGRVLFVFHCNNDPGMCDDWAQDSGGNAAFIVEARDLGHGMTQSPAPNTPCYPDVRVGSWVEFDDGVAPTLARSFYSDELLLGLDDTTIAKVTMGTRLGGVPAWIQSAGEAPPGFRFIGQLDSTYSFYCAMPPAAARGGIRCVPDADLYEGRTWSLDGPNFGDGGIGYIFLRDNKDVPEVRFFWQCG